MRQFDPTRPPNRRLTRLGVVVDIAESETAVRLARLCDRAGIDAIWLADRSLIGQPSPDTGKAGFAAALDVAETLRGSVHRTRTGLIASPDDASGLSEQAPLDELCLTIAPYLVGGLARRIATGPGQVLARMRCAHVLSDDAGYLYTRYVKA